MIEIEQWMQDLVVRLLELFDARLLFLGLQGSYGRGEATANSDIDVVTILDQVELSDLEAYHTVVAQLPMGEKACGFLCGVAELHNWPHYDLIQLAQDTTAFHGSLDSLLPTFTRADLIEGAAIGASGIYHAACHTFLYDSRETWPDFLSSVYKNAFFVLRTLYEVRTGQIIRTKRELLPLLAGDERKILEYSLNPQNNPESQDAQFDRLLHWSGRVLREVQALTSDKNSLT